MVAVSSVQSQWSEMTSGSSTPRWRARARTCIQPEAKATSGSAKRRTQVAAKAEGGPSTTVPAKSRRGAAGDGGVGELAEGDAAAGVIVAEPAQRAVEVDRRVVAGVAQQADHPLRLAERVDADEVGALGELRRARRAAADLVERVGVAEHRQRRRSPR